jgi:benzoyl-CoA reductase/2-hydroxyglutaryl-CoA dehydratase subunit BcrC/BadD/HgdB
MKELRKKTIQKEKEKGKKIAAVFPIHYPRELLRAFGYHPVEVWGPPGVEREEGFKHFQSYTCDIVMRGFSFILKRKEVDLILVPHTCDSLQGMASVMRDFVKPPVPVLTLYHPRGRKKEDLEFLEREIKRLFEKLSEITGKVPEKEELMRAITEEEKADSIFKKLYEIRDDLNLTDREFYEFLRTREFLPPEDFISLAESLPRGRRKGEGKRIIISGILPEPMEIFDLINRKGGIVVDDDLACCGRRIYENGKSDDPFRRMAERILSAPPDPTLGSKIEDRIEYLLKKMEKRKAKGILIYNPKFCEPELFDFPFIKKELTNCGIKVQFIETEISRETPHQTIQRIDTFLEVL